MWTEAFFLYVTMACLKSVFEDDLHSSCVIRVNFGLNLWLSCKSLHCGQRWFCPVAGLNSPLPANILWFCNCNSVKPSKEVCALCEELANSSKSCLAVWKDWRFPKWLSLLPVLWPRPPSYNLLISGITFCSQQPCAHAVSHPSNPNTLFRSRGWVRCIHFRVLTNARSPQWWLCTGSWSLWSAPVLHSGRGSILTKYATREDDAVRPVRRVCFALS